MTKLHAQVPFGAYCEIHDEQIPTKSMVAQTQPTNSLRTCGNFQGLVYFYQLWDSVKMEVFHRAAYA